MPQTSKIDSTPLHAIECLRASMLPQQAVEQVAHLLYLKWIDEVDAQRREEGKEAIFEGSALRYTWAEWSCLKGTEMLDILRNRVFPYLAAQVKVDPEVGEYFRSVRMEIELTSELQQVVDLIGKLQILQMSDSARGALMDGLLRKVPTSPSDGQMFTPDPLRELLVQIARPEPSDTILDPCCGTGVLLGRALAAAKRFECNLAEMPSNPSLGQVKGVELVWPLARLARLNLIFHGQPAESVSCGNSLDPAGPLSEQELSRGYSIVIANPPFGGRESLGKVRADLGLESRYTELLFLALAMKALAPSGRAVVVVPEGLLFGMSPVHVEMRRKLLEDFDVHAVISLGGRGLLPISSLKMSVLVFSRRPCLEGRIDKPVWFYELSPTPSRRQVGREGDLGLSVFLSIWESYARYGFSKPPGINTEKVMHFDDPEPTGWWVSVQKIQASGGILSASYYKPSRKAPLADMDALRLQIEEPLTGLAKAIDELRGTQLDSEVDYESFQQVRLGDLLVPVPSSTLGTVDGEDVFYVEPSNIDSVSNMILHPQRLKREDLPARARWRLREGDVLVHTARANSSGIALVPSKAHGAFASGIFAVLRPDPEKILPEFLLHQLLEPVFLNKIAKMARGTTMPTLSLSTICDTMIRVPSLTVQRDVMAPLNCISKLLLASDSITAKARMMLETLRLKKFGSNTDTETNQFHS